MESVQQLANQPTPVNTALYLYCIIEAGKTPADGLTSKGLDDKDLEIITHRDLSVVVSAAGKERQPATRNALLRHTIVLEEIMKHQQILPIRFGIVANNQEDVVNNVLKANYWNFKDLLQKLDGKKELGLKVLWNQAAVLNSLLETDQEIRHLRDSLLGKSETAIYHDKIKLGRMVEAAVIAKQNELKNDILETLAVLADEYRENRLLTDAMILNAAFLIPMENESLFDERLDALSEKYKDFLTFKYTAIAPPYNFINLVIKV